MYTYQAVDEHGNLLCEVSAEHPDDARREVAKVVNQAKLVAFGLGGQTVLLKPSNANAMRLIEEAGTVNGALTDAVMALESLVTQWFEQRAQMDQGRQDVQLGRMAMVVRELAVLRTFKGGVF